MSYLSTTVLNCAKCGKIIEVGFIAEDKVYCSECMNEITKAEKDCAKCAYFDWKIKVSPETVNCKKLDLSPKCGGIKAVVWDAVVKKYFVWGTVFFSFPDAKQCIHYVDKEEYRQKALKGEIATKKETHFVKCEFCGTRYDIVSNIRCPTCGAPHP